MAQALVDDPVDVAVSGRSESLSACTKNALRARLELSRLNPGQRIVWRPEPGRRGIYFVLDGYFKLPIEHGENNVRLSIAGPGDAIGAVALFEPLSEPFVGIAVTSARVAYLSDMAVADLMRTHPEVSRLFVSILSRKASEADDDIAAWLWSEVSARLAKALLRLATAESVDAPRQIRGLRQSDLARFAGLSRESVTRSLGVLESHGWVERAPGTIVIRDADALQRWSGRIRSRPSGRYRHATRFGHVA